MGVRAGRIEQMIEAGELERVGDDPTANPRVYRETRTGRYRIGCDAHGLWTDRWATEHQARAVAEFAALRREVDEGIRSVGLASIDASAAGHKAASPLLAQATALLLRAAEALEETPQTEGDGPGSGAILLNLDDPDDAAEATRRRAAREAAEKATPIEAVLDATRARIVEYERAHGERSHGEGLNEGDRQRIHDAQREAGANLSDALIDQAWRLFGWSADRAAAVYRETLYTPCGQDDDGVDIVLAIPLKDVVFLDREGQEPAPPDAEG